MQRRPITVRPSHAIGEAREENQESRKEASGQVHAKPLARRTVGNHDSLHAIRPQAYVLSRPDIPGYLRGDWGIAVPDQLLRTATHRQLSLPCF